MNKAMIAFLIRSEYTFFVFLTMILLSFSIALFGLLISGAIKKKKIEL